MKKTIIAVLIAATVMGSFVVCEGAKADTVRIGLERQYTGVSSITVGNEDINISLDGGKSYTLNGGVLSVVNTTYYDTGKAFSDFDKACEYMEDGIVVLQDDAWAVYYEKTEKDEKAEAVAVNEIMLKTSDLEIILACDSYITLTSSNGIVDLGGTSYRGEIEIKADGSTLSAVNELSVDEYLYGVVPAEIYSSWGAEALKAQSVAARTYAYYSMGKHNAYDLCDSTHCQMYKGYNIEEESTNRAVDATSGEMIYYNNEPICAVYFDCSGGHTVSAEAAWGSDIPYLQARIDEYEVEPKTWSKTFTLDELTKVADDMGYDVGDVVNVSVGELTNNILVESINITGTKGTARVEGIDIKKFFAKDGENLDGRCFTVSGGNAPVNNVYVSAIDKNREKVELEVVSVIDGEGNITVLDDLNCVVKSASGEVVISGNTGQVTEANDTIVIDGKGWGHGVGMSQRGACGLAENGYSYEEILKYYYQGVKIK